MHPCQLRMHHFFVPNRILDDQWEDFITGDGNAQAPFFEAPDQTLNLLLNYLGVPIPDAGFLNSFPVRAYLRIWNDYYRDQETQLEISVPDDQINLQFVNYEKDYFSTVRIDPSSNPSGRPIPVQDDNGDLSIDPFDLRKSMARLRYDEARSRYGKRYVEYLRYLGVKPSDARLQRPEYLGGGTSTINFSEVLQTVDEPTNPLGKLGGHGVAGLRTKPFTRFFEEHGIFMTLFSVRPKAIYSQGIQKEWKKLTNFAYWQKETQYEGLQSLFNYEVYMNGNQLEDGLPFGYTDRHEEYRRGVSRVSAEMRAGEIYDNWHLARQFDDRPGLNSVWSLVRSQDHKRIFADQGSDGFIVATNHRIAARRLVTNRPTPRTV